MKNNNKAVLICLIIMLGGCSMFDRADRLRTLEIKPDTIVGINITDATRRIAVIYSDGRICSELSPPAILEVDKAFVAGAKGTVSGVPIEGNVDKKTKTTAVKLTTSTEAIECLRISLFNACGIAANNKLNADQEVSLYREVLDKCRSMSPVK